MNLWQIPRISVYRCPSDQTSERLQSEMISKFSVACATIVVFFSVAECWPWSSAVVARTNLQNLNWVVDTILSSVSNKITKEHAQEWSVPESNVNWHQGLNFYVLWFEAYGSVVAEEEATIRNLNAITRLSDAGILQEKKSADSELVTLHAQIRVQDLEVKYSSIDVGVWFVTYSGGLSVKCPDNVFEIAVQFDNEESCTSTVKSAVIKELPSCTVELDQPGVLNWFKRHIITYALRQILSTIKETLNKALPTVLNSIMQKHDACTFLNPSAAS